MCFYLIWVMQDTCASRRIPCNPIWFRYFLLMGQNPSVLGGYACTRVNVCVASDILDLIEFLHRFSYVHTNSHEYILVLGKIAQSVRWWIIPHRNTPNLPGSLSHCSLSDSEDRVTIVYCCLLQRLAFSKLCHFSSDILPAKYHGPWHSRHEAVLSCTIKR